MMCCSFMLVDYFVFVLGYLWKIWSIQGFMILSLTVQLILAFVAPLRKKTSNSVIIFIVWLAYFLTDWTAIFTFGLIATAGYDNSSTYLKKTKKLLALWASFLLVHLGGPDTITAYSLEDNSLWIRHLFGLFAKVITFIYIFFKMPPDITILAPTLLVFATGLIKYSERIRALFLASLKNFEDTTFTLPNQGNDERRKDDVRTLEREDDNRSMNDMTLLDQAGHFFQIFKGLIVDIMPNRSQRHESREFFLHNEALSAFKVIELELNMLYEVFYTKIIAAYSSWGVYIRTFAYYMTVAALILFCSIKKDGLKLIDVLITYALFVGLLILDTTSEVMLVTSYWRSKNKKILAKHVIARCFIPFLLTWLMYEIVIYLLNKFGCQSIVERSWSSKIGSFNLLDYSFEDRPRKRCALSRCCHSIFGCIHTTTGIEFRKVKEEIGKMRYTKRNDMDDDLWKHIFDILHDRAFGADEAGRVKEIYEARGELALRDASVYIVKSFWASTIDMPIIE